MLLLAGLFFVAFGLFLLFAQDFIWDLQKYSRQVQGIDHVAKRTEAWSLDKTCGGILFLCVGTGFILAYFLH